MEWISVKDRMPDKEVAYAAKLLTQKIKFPAKKPGALLTIDDRAICFDGDYSTLKEKIENFRPWNKPTPPSQEDK